MTSIVAHSDYTQRSPLVSAIIIFLNAEDFIAEAIESVLAQTYEDWELFLVDDGSTDGSTAISKRYAKQHLHKIHYVNHTNHQNRGMSASRNLGILHAQGKYISFLDADDVWLPDKLIHQVTLLQAQPKAAMVCGNTLYWNSWANDPADPSADYTPEFTITLDQLYKPPDLVKILFKGGGTMPCICGFVAEREAIKAIGGFEESFRGLYEDQVFFAKVFLNLPVYFESRYSEKYRQHPNSACSAASRHKEHQAREIFLLWLETQLAGYRFEDTKLWGQLQKELWAYRHPLVLSIVNNTQSLGHNMKSTLDLIVRRLLPKPAYAGLRNIWYGLPPVGWVDFGSFRRRTPISRQFGYDRGLPIDRYYIEGFLEQQKTHIQGRVLEVGETTYTRRYGDNHVTHSDVLYVIEGNPEATIVGDLTTADHIPSDIFDCIIITQTLHLIYDMKAAVKTLHRILKPGGVLLATFPGISQVVKCDWGDSWCWALTEQSGRLLLEEFFPAEHVQVISYGNVLAAISFLQGLSAEDLRKKDLDFQDSEYEVLITATAIKPASYP